MPDEVSTTTVNAVKTMSDGSVKISIEKYEELLKRAAEKPPVVHNVINKTVEMLAAEHRAWGGTFMGLGAAFFVVGAFRFKAGKS